jgi:transmembrane sensor
MHTEENKLIPDNLITGYLRKELTPEETNELVRWIGSDPENKRRFDEYCEIWITAMAGTRHPEYNFHEGFWKFKKRIAAENQPVKEVKKKSLFREMLKYAAIFLITAALSGITFYYLAMKQYKPDNKAYSELIVPMGASARFILSDGTTVTLNAGSRLRFDNSFGIRNRIVNLEGEGFFNVAKESDKPFIVKTSHLNVTALGTAFNVKAYSNDNTIETTLVEGSVKIEGIASETVAEAMMLKPNQRMTYFKEDSKLVEEPSSAEKSTESVSDVLSARKQMPVHRVVTENINVEPVISWKENKWIFESQSLEKIAVDLERRFDVEIHFGSERLKSFRFTGTILAEPIEQVLEVMSLSAPIDFDLNGKIVTLSEGKNFDALNKDLYNQSPNN